MTNTIWTTGIARVTELEDVELTSSASLDILQRNSSGTYVNRQPVGTEASTTNNSAAANDTAIGAGTRKYSFFTMPSTAPLWLITGFEWKNGTVQNGSAFCAAEIVDASPPTDANCLLAAWAKGVTASGASSVQRVSAVSSTLIPAGTVLGAFLVTASATGRYLTSTVASANNTRSITASQDYTTGNSTAWTATTEEPYMKLYYKPVLGI